MKILAIVQGNYGRRMAETWQRSGPAGWEIKTLEITSSLPPMIEDPSEFLPENCPATDLLISLGEHPGVAELLPDIARGSNARAVIAPVDNRAWLPPGLARQLERALAKKEVAVIFPTTFCALTEDDSDNPLILTFARLFGRPEIEISVQNDRVHEVRVIRGAPCGCTDFVARELKGTKIMDAEEKSGILHHNYPCLATMNMDPQLHDTLMHRAGYLTKEAVNRAVKRQTLPPLAGQPAKR